jgi:hypothetical protein
MVDNFSWVIDGLLAGSALPGGRWVDSPDQLRADLADLHDRGVRVLVSLLKVSDALPRLCRRLDIRWLSYPIDNFSIPQDERSFDRLIDETLASIEQRSPVCFHCFAGVGRTGSPSAAPRAASTASTARRRSAPSAPCAMPWKPTSRSVL